MKWSVERAALAACVTVVVVVVQAHLRDARSGNPRVSGDRAEIVEGQARVVDGDTLVVAGQRVRLEGIDAPEKEQKCKPAAPGGSAWPAGRVATATLQRLVRGRSVICRSNGRDRYGRMLGRCHAGGIDLNAAMIWKGAAWAFVKYSRTFVDDERRARAAGLGVWSADCQPAWAFRANRWRDEAARAAGGCIIKGNISRGGRIYHMPWGRWYGRTRIDPRKGERWFCNEAEAMRAGWRPAL